jgi:hypothetical protein
MGDIFVDFEKRMAEIQEGLDNRHAVIMKNISVARENLMKRFSDYSKVHNYNQEPEGEGNEKSKAEDGLTPDPIETIGEVEKLLETLKEQIKGVEEAISKNNKGASDGKENESSNQGQ